MNLFNFEYFTERAEILTEMARPFVLFGAGTPANVKYKELMNQLVQEYPGKPPTSYRIILDKYFLDKFNKKFEIYKFSKQDLSDYIESNLRKIASIMFDDENALDLTDEDMKNFELNSDSSLLGDILYHFEKKLNKSGYKAFNKNFSTMIKNNNKLKMSLQIIKSLITEDKNEYVLSGNEIVRYESDGLSDASASRSTLEKVSSENKEQFNNSDFINSLNSEEAISYAETASERSIRSKGMEKARVETTGIKFKDFSQLENYLKPTLKQLNRDMHTRNIRIGRGGKGGARSESEAVESQDSDIGLPFSTLYIDNILDILSTLISERKKLPTETSNDIWGKRDQQLGPSNISINPRYLNYEISIPSQLLKSFSPKEIEDVYTAFENIYDKFENDQLEYTEADLSKLIDRVKDKNPKLSNLLEFFKTSLSGVEKQKDEIQQDQSFIGYDDDLVRKYFPDTNSEEFKNFTDWYTAKTKYEEKLKNDLLERIINYLASMKEREVPEPDKNEFEGVNSDLMKKLQTYENKIRSLEKAYKYRPTEQLKSEIDNLKEIIDSIKSKYNTEEPQQDEEELAVMDYMTEQVKKDKLLNSKGQFVEKMNKKPLNYWHWSQING
jgi:hypothetical protein